jgi:nucleoside-diphosphate-sugar epimerase
MSILVIGGAGFIGRRMIPILVAAGQNVTCMDIDAAGATAAFAKHGDKVKVVRGDVTQFDDVMGAVQESRAEKLVNLSYFIGELAPHVAFKLDIQGMDNCFEAARRFGVKHTVFASSVAVSGQQSHFGERLVDEGDERRGNTQYAVNKIINEWQARCRRRRASRRPANGPPRHSPP